MAASLVPCSSCGRHIRVVEGVCPFCAAVVQEDLSARIVPMPTQRLGRSALFAFAASVAVTGTACSSTITSVDEGSKDAASDASRDARSVDDGGGQAIYGAPAPPLDGGVTPVYGAPPPRDAGPDAMDGGAAPLYGMPPPPSDSGAG